MSPGEGNGWAEWKRAVLSKLDDNAEGVTELRHDVAQLRVDVARLQLKSGIWGAMAGAIPAIAALLFLLLKG